MKRVALDVGALAGGVEKALVEEAVVPDQHRPVAAVRFDRLAHRLEHALEGGQLAHRAAQRVVGVDAGEIQRRLLDIGAGKGVDVEVHTGRRAQVAAGVHVQQYRGDFQQGVVAGVEAPGFNVHHHRQEAAEAQGQGRVLISHALSSQRSTCYPITAPWDR